MSDESPEVIEQQMQVTRDSLTEKVSALENHVVDTIQNATTSVGDIVDQVKTAVPDTIAGMKDTFSEVKESVRESLDVSQHTRDRPWAMVGGAAALGLIAGMVLFRRRAGSAPAPAVAQPQSFASNAMPASTTAPRAPVKLPGWLDQIVDRLGDKLTEEVRKLGEVAVATASASLQNTVEQVLPRVIGHLTPAGVTEPTNRPVSEPARNGFHAAALRV